MAVVQAPSGDIDRMRRPLRPGHVLVTLEHLLILTWNVPQADLRRRLPPPLDPVTVDGAGLVSVLLFRNRALRPALMGLPRMRSFQMNVRTYVRVPATGAPGSVFFLGLHVSRAWLARVSSWLFGVPFRYLPFTITVGHEGDALDWEARSADNRVAVHATEADVDVDAGILDLLTNPHTGYFVDRRGALRGWSIWHRAQEVRTMVVERTTIASLPELKVLNVGKPMPALYVRSVDYEVYLPPRKVKSD